VTLQVPSESTDEISYYDFSRSILEGENLENKLFNSSIAWDPYQNYSLPLLPGRSKRISFSDKQLKFPKVSRLNENDKKAMALHSFANHELLAVEMMAAALLIYQHDGVDSLRFKKGILSALKDEQKHFKMYVTRLNELGYEFGDFPLNDFFWRQMDKLQTPAQYSAVMSLTFEAANLDFAHYFSQIFRQMEDHKTAEILDIVLEDEITHVAFGSYWLKKWKNNSQLWDYYLQNLPWPLTPARSKGLSFNTTLRLRAIGESEFVTSLSSYKDDFEITTRK
jgi:uncharacterized ferritin-like protein (DUF455 family)